MVTEASRKHREVFIVGASGGVKTRLGKLKIWNFVPRQNLVGTRIKALQQTLNLLVERKI